MKKSLCLLLILWGLLGSIGVLGRMRELRFYAYASLASPILIVYSDSEGLQNMALRANLELMFDDGSAQSFEFNKELYHKIVSHEPFYIRHIVTLPYFAAVTLLIDAGSSPEMRESILRYGFCGEGRMREYLGVKKRPSRLKISFRSEKVKQRLPEPFELSCRK